MAPIRFNDRRCVTVYIQAHGETAPANSDASNWNSLLRWHRRKRGPQWDYSTAMYHVDQGSPEYFGGVEPLPKETVKIEDDKPESPERPLTRKAEKAKEQNQQERIHTNESDVSGAHKSAPQRQPRAMSQSDLGNVLPNYNINRQATQQQPQLQPIPVQVQQRQADNMYSSVRQDLPQMPTGQGIPAQMPALYGQQMYNLTSNPVQAQARYPGSIAPPPAQMQQRLQTQPQMQQYMPNQGGNIPYQPHYPDASSYQGSPESRATASFS